MSRRRANNEGSVYRYRGGRWCAQISIDGFRETKYFDSQAEALDWLRDMNNRKDRGLSAKGLKASVDQFLRLWLESCKPTVKLKTWNQYEQMVRTHISPTLGNRKLTDLAPVMIQSLYSKKIEEGLSAYTVRRIHAVLHRALKIAVRWGYLATNPASVVDKPKLNRKEMKVFSHEQVLIFLDQCRASRLFSLYYMAISTGLRQGELLGLKWEDLDWNEETIIIRRQLQRISRMGLVFSDLKTFRGRRTLVLGPNTMENLRDHTRRQSIEESFAGDRWHSNNLVFPSTIGTPMEPRNVIRDFKGVLGKAGLPDIRFHDLRHTAATLMLQEGIHPKLVQERLGHSSISITLDTYSHVLPTMHKEAAIALDGLLSPIPVEL